MLGDCTGPDFGCRHSDTSCHICHCGALLSNTIQPPPAAACTVSRRSWTKCYRGAVNAAAALRSACTCICSGWFPLDLMINIYFWNISSYPNMLQLVLCERLVSWLRWSVSVSGHFLHADHNVQVTSVRRMIQVFCLPVCCVLLQIPDCISLKPLSRTVGWSHRWLRWIQSQWEENYPCSRQLCGDVFQYSSYFIGDNSLPWVNAQFSLLNIWVKIVDVVLWWWRSKKRNINMSCTA